MAAILQREHLGCNCSWLINHIEYSIKISKYFIQLLEQLHNTGLLRSNLSAFFVGKKDVLYNTKGCNCDPMRGKKKKKLRKNLRQHEALP